MRVLKDFFYCMSDNFILDAGGEYCNPKGEQRESTFCPFRGCGC